RLPTEPAGIEVRYGLAVPRAVRPVRLLPGLRGARGPRVAHLRALPPDRTGGAAAGAHVLRRRPLARGVPGPGPPPRPPGGAAAGHQRQYGGLAKNLAGLGTCTGANGLQIAPFRLYGVWRRSGALWGVPNAPAQWSVRFGAPGPLIAHPGSSVRAPTAF